MLKCSFLHMNNIIDTDIIDWVADNRPSNKEEISQYFLDKKSLYDSLKYLEPWVRNRSILFLGDGDHISILVSYFFNVNSFVYDIDDDILMSLDNLSEKLDIKERVKTFKYDARDEWGNKVPFFDCFHINPPFSKSNKGQGAKFWLFRCLQKTKNNGIGICNMPTTRQRKWSSENWFEVQKFLSDNNCVIDTISEPFQSYENVSARRKIHSSVIIMHKIGGLQTELPIPENLYR